MQRLELNPPLLILMMGLPGAGKTFFARQFAEQYKLPLLSDDRIRFELFEKPRFTSDEQDIIERILNYGLEQVMKSESTVVCDGNYASKKQRELVYRIANNNGYKCLIVWVQTDQATSLHRAKNRDRRNADSRYTFSVDDVLFKKLANQLTRPSEKEPMVVISGKNAFKGQSLTVLRRITEMHAQTVLKQNTVTSPKQLIQ